MTTIPQTLTPEQMEQIAAMRQQMGGQGAPEAAKEEPGVMDKVGDALGDVGKTAFSVVKSAAMMVAVGAVAGGIREGIGEIKSSMSEASPADNQTPAAAPNNASASVDAPAR